MTAMLSSKKKKIPTALIRIRMSLLLQKMMKMRVSKESCTVEK